MARRGNQLKRGIDQTSTKNKKKDLNVDDDLLGGEHLNSPLKEGANRTSIGGDGRKKNKKYKSAPKKDEPKMDNADVGPSVPDSYVSGEGVENLSRDSNMTHVSNQCSESHDGSFSHSVNGFYTADRTEMQFTRIVVLEILRHSALSILRTSYGWLERQKPVFTALMRNVYKIRDYIQLKISLAYPIVLKWLLHLGNILLLVSMIWLDCAFRGMDSFLRMGTPSFFAVVWFSAFSVIAMIGMFKFLLVLAFAALIGYFVGFIVSLLIIAITGGIFLWLYGSFWTTSVAIFLAGLAFVLSHERVALLITTVYSLYCAWAYVGWFGVLLGFNLSFISSDALMYFLKNNIDEQRSKPFERADGPQGDRSFYNGEAHFQYSDIGSGQSTDRSAGVASTSGADSEITSEDEVVRLLNCTDHYSALGLSRYQQIDVSVLKREYRKKAMLVHPDKNMGNEKAADAFKKLQNAYEVLLDSLKRKSYDDELRKEELLNYFCRFQSSQKNGRHGFFPNGFARSEGDGEDPLGEPRRIACKKCGSFHIWFQTKKSKSKARWCQDCEEFHQAKDGDGWVEQSSQPLLFGILRKVDVPVAYVCADGSVYDATEWYLCQGMRCPANSHKPSFHVNTSVTKNNYGKGSSSSHRGGGAAASNMEENMTEEEFFEWLHNAVQSGLFQNSNGAAPNESSHTSAKNSPKTGSATPSGGGGGGGSSSRRKKKGKKQW